MGQCVLCLLVVVVVVGVVARNTPCAPGGTYFDKHVGQRGRWACCAEICEPKGFFTSSCDKKCPNYKDLKAATPPATDRKSPSDLPYILGPVAAILIVGIVVAVVIGKYKCWQGVLQRQDAAATPQERQQGEEEGATTVMEETGQTEEGADAEGAEEGLLPAEGERSDWCVAQTAEVEGSRRPVPAMSGDFEHVVTGTIR